MSSLWMHWIFQITVSWEISELVQMQNNPAKNGTAKPLTEQNHLKLYTKRK